MQTHAPQVATAQDREVRLAAVVRTLSGRWPHLLGQARPHELPITPDQLAAVVAGWDRLDFADAFLRCDLEALRERASNPVTTDACMGLGAHLLTAIETHAREELLREVQVHRDFCDGLRLEAQRDRAPRRETDESYYGVASVFRSRA